MRLSLLLALLLSACGTEENDDAAAAEEAACEELMEPLCSKVVECRVRQADGRVWTSAECSKVIDGMIENLCLPRLMTAEAGPVERCRSAIAESTCESVCAGDLYPPACESVLDGIDSEALMSVECVPPS